MQVDLNSDLELDGAEAAGTGAAPQANKSGDGSDYKARYAGQVAVYNKLRDESAAKQSRLEATIAQLESDLNKLRGEKSSLEGTVSALTADKTKFEADLARVNSRLELLGKQEEARAKIATSHPELLNMAASGDLKLPSEFENEDKYNEYLTRMSKWATPAQDSRGAGAPPPPRHGGNGVRTIADIEAEIDQTDGLRDPRKMDALFTELSELQRKGQQ